jgi:hypothetical protein
LGEFSLEPLLTIDLVVEHSLHQRPRSCGGILSTSTMPMGGGAINGSDRGADRNLRHPAAGRSQRAARSHFHTIEVAKLTSFASVVALPELLYSSEMARAVTYNASPMVLAALIYLVLLWPLVRLVSLSNTASAAESTGVR